MKCPGCNKKGRIVQGQTVKALLSDSLRLVENAEYYFCDTRSCPVVYYSPAGSATFTTAQVRETVFQKEPDNDEVFICYCFKHTVGAVRSASTQTRAAMIDDINTGIQMGQCACDLRNPQGNCCLGNVLGLIKQLDKSGIKY